MPAAGELLAPSVIVRAAPSAEARVVREMKQFRKDSQFQVVLAVKARRGSDGTWWYMLSLPGRPNGQRGWVRGDLVDLQPMNRRIVVHVASRTIAVRRISDGKLLLRAVAAFVLASCGGDSSDTSADPAQRASASSDVNALLKTTFANVSKPSTHTPEVG